MCHVPTDVGGTAGGEGMRDDLDRWWSAGKPYVIKPCVVQGIHSFIQLVLQSHGQKFDRMDKGRSAGVRRERGQQLRYALPCAWTRSEMLYSANGLADQGELHSCMPPSRWGEAEAISALLQYRTLR